MCDSFCERIVESGRERGGRKRSGLCVVHSVRE